MNIQQQLNSALLAVGGVKKLNMMADLEEHKAKGEEFLPHPETGEGQWTTRADYAHTLSDTIEKQVKGGSQEDLDQYIKGAHIETGIEENEIRNMLDYTGASQRIAEQRALNNHQQALDTKRNIAETLSVRDRVLREVSNRRPNWEQEVEAVKPKNQIKRGDK